MTRALSEQDVAARIAMPAALDAIRGSFARLAAGHVHHGARVQVPSPHGYFATMSAADDVLGLACVKSYAAVDGALEGFSLVVNSTADGGVRGVIEADALTRIRTGAASGVAAGALAAPGARTVGIIGCGRQAPCQLEAVRCALPGVRALAWCRRADELRRFCARTGAEPVASAAEVMACDVVIAATTSSTPVIEGRRLRDGALVIAIGGGRHGDRELDDDVLRRADLVTCDALASSRAEAADIWEPVVAGIIGWKDVVELGNVLNGTHPGRRCDADVVVFKSNGLGAWDLALAALLLPASA